VRGCLFTLLLGIVAIALIVTIGIPAVVAGALTAGIRTAGLQADDLTVDVSSEPPTDLLGLRADRVRVRATHATFRGLGIGGMDVTLLGVSLLDRTADSVAGRLTDVMMANVDGQSLDLASVSLAGGGDAITAQTTIPGRQAASLIGDAISTELDVTPASVQLVAPDRVVVKTAGQAVTARLSVDAGGDLVAVVQGGPLAGTSVTLLHAGADVPMRLTAVTVTPAGDLRLDGDLTIGLLG
jgi:hypothetical protein